MKLTLVGAVLVLGLRTMAAVPPQQPARSSIEGFVVGAGTGNPVPGARVSLTRIGANASIAGCVSNGPVVVADSAGKFQFKDLEPAPYRVCARAMGYAKQEYGQLTAGGQGRTINLNPGQTVRDVGISLTPAGVVTGRVHDNSGQPAVGVQVQILMASYNANGQRTFQSGGLARTDDRGEYRLYWITPGRYYLVATNETNGANGTIIGSPNEVNAEVIIPPTYYPGTPDLTQASVIEVKPGADMGGVDIFVNRQNLYRIRGRVIDENPRLALQGLNLTLATASPTGNSSSINVKQSYNSQDGSFELRDVSPGLHVLRAQTLITGNSVSPETSGLVMAASAGTMWLNVTSDMDGVVLSMASVVPISGQISMDGPLPSGRQGLNLLRVQLKPSMDGVLSNIVGGPAPTSQSSKLDGSFRIDTVLPGEYRLSVDGLPEGVYVKQARFNQADVLNKPMQFASSDSGILEVQLSSRGGQIDGTVTDEKQQPAPGIQAVLVPEQQRDRVDLYKTATTNADGRYTIRGIAPGDYRVFAWEALDPYAYFDTGVLKQYEPKGKPVHIAESAKESVDVRTISIEP